MWPLTALNLEPKFSVPTSLKIDEVVLVNGFVGSFLSDYFWYASSNKTAFFLFYYCYLRRASTARVTNFDLSRALSVVWTTPLVATLGMSLTIPLAMVADILIHGRYFSAIYILGSVQVNDQVALAATRFMFLFLVLCFISNDVDGLFRYLLDL